MFGLLHSRGLASGAGSPALADLLARSGVKYLLVRNDLDRAAAGTPRPALVHQALDRSLGLRRVASFGPVVGGSFRTPLSVTGYDDDTTVLCYACQNPVTLEEQARSEYVPNQSCPHCFGRPKEHKERIALELKQ